jgi:hypothetical protein
VQQLGTDQGANHFASATGTGSANVPAGSTIELWCWQGIGATGPFPVINNGSITAVSIAKTTVTEDTSSDQYGGG